MVLHEWTKDEMTQIVMIRAGADIEYTLGWKLKLCYMTESLMDIFGQLPKECSLESRNPRLYWIKWSLYNFITAVKLGTIFQ
jgi:hypothetical protein